EQLAAVWHGPLDHARFTAAWESVFARESVLRAAFEDGPEPSIVLHERVVPEIVRHAHGSIDWYALAEEDRRRGLDPRTPGPLRITVLGGDPHPSARILLTFHHALLDAWSVRLLLRQFRRAYLAGGSLPGGERRPDIGDHADWLAARDTAPARAFWSRADTGPGTDLPGPGDGTGTGHLRTRLTVRQTARLRAWAARWGSPESSALHAAWALL
ncbi:condensation domain-containing protein, partial [Streptomyces viridosporus]|uniref:condensation domain-containing protein n=1 Tax=Streptomyces viridosporus TaxID=67581 RepID=UPI002100464A